LPFAEVAVSYIDGSSSSGPVVINDPSRLKTLVSQWNQWVNGPVNAFSVSTGTFSTENGPEVLRSIGTHRCWFTGNNDLLRIGRKPVGLSRQPHPFKDDSVVDLRKKKRYLANNSPYLNRFAAAVTSVAPFLSAAYENVLGTWILPVAQIELDSSNNDMLVPRIQGIFVENNLTPTTTGADGLSMYDMHLAYALKMVKANLSDQSDWSSMIKGFNDNAKGGILSGILASVVGSAFPGLGGVASSIASALPF